MVCAIEVIDDLLCAAGDMRKRNQETGARPRLLVLVDGKFMTLRIPYPMGYYGKGFDGRIDDPNGGWKGKAVYTTFATRATSWRAFSSSMQ